MTYRIYLCGPSDCPCDPLFDHDSYYGCIPKNFSTNTGRSRTHSQTCVVHPNINPRGGGHVYVWNGGCGAVRVMVLRLAGWDGAFPSVVPRNRGPMTLSVKP